MKKSEAPKEYGPETPGYAQLNEAIRRAGIPVKPAKISKAKKGTVSTHEKPA